MGLFGKENHFYNAAVRGYVSLFGTLFSDMVIKRGDKWLAVPLRFGAGNLYEKVAQNAAERDQTRIREILPAAAFTLDDYQRDSTRQTSRYQPADVGQGLVALKRVPYNFNFTMTTRMKNMEDHLQLLEMIGNVFDPTHTVRFRPWADSEQYENVVIEMSGFAVADNWESQADDADHIIQTDYTFTLKGYMNRPLTKVARIEEVVYATGVEEMDMQKTVFVSDNGTLKILREQDALKHFIEQGMVDANPSSPELTKQHKRRKRLNN